MTLFRIDQAVFELFPNARFAAVVARGANNQGENPAIADLLDESVDQIREQFGGGDPKADPRIAIWREAFGSRGWTPSKYLSSIEALVRRIAKGGDMPRISPAVDLANSISLSLLVPIGAHDLGTAPNGIDVRLSATADRFQPMAMHRTRRRTTARSSTSTTMTCAPAAGSGARVVPASSAHKQPTSFFRSMASRRSPRRRSTRPPSGSPGSFPIFLEARQRSITSTRNTPTPVDQNDKARSPGRSGL